MNNVFIAHTAYVAPTALLADFAVVMDNARVLDEVLIREHGRVMDSATVKDLAYVGGYAVVGDNAIIGGSVRLLGNCYVGTRGYVMSQEHVLYGNLLGIDWTLYRTLSPDGSYGWDLDIAGSTRSVETWRSNPRSLLHAVGQDPDCLIDLQPEHLLNQLKTILQFVE